MGKIKALFQEEQDTIWQQAYDNYCLDNFGGRQPEGADHDEAVESANDAVDDWLEERNCS